MYFLSVSVLIFNFLFVCFVVCRAPCRRIDLWVSVLLRVSLCHSVFRWGLRFEATSNGRYRNSFVVLVFSFGGQSNSIRGWGHRRTVGGGFLNRCYSVGFFSDGEGGRRGKRAVDAWVFCCSFFFFRFSGGVKVGGNGMKDRDVEGLSPFLHLLPVIRRTNDSEKEVNGYACVRVACTIMRECEGVVESEGKREQTLWSASSPCHSVSRGE